MIFEPVKIGVVGLGSFGLLHAKTLQGLAEARLVYVVDRRKDRLEVVTGVGHSTDVAQALSESSAEAWVVASSTRSHVPVTQAILAAGKPVLVEKPLAPSLAEAEALRPLVRADSSNLMLGHILLFSSEFVELRQEASRRGPIRYINAVRHRPATTRDLLPGESPLHLTMVHDLYATLVLMNRSDPSRLRLSKRDPDLAVAQLEWGNHTLATLTASFLTPPGMPADGFDRMEVFGDGWAARTHANPRPFELYDDRARWPVGLEVHAGNPPTGMLAEELRCFCRVVRGVHPVPSGATYSDALQVLGWMDRLEAAAC